MDDYYKFQNKRTELSNFNEATFQILRLNYLWSNINNYIMKCDVNRWSAALHVIWVELTPDAYIMNKEFYDKSINTFDKAILDSSNDKKKQFVILLKKSQFLKILQDKAGKGSKRSHMTDRIM